MIHDDALSRLASLPSSDERDAFVEFISSGGDDAFRRDGGAEHVTASCFVFTPDLTRTLLCFHSKGRFWVQLGGHVEHDDATVAQAALREAHEESGMTGLTLLSESIADVNRHELNGGFSCRAHWDIGFVAVTTPDAGITVSEESEDVRWFRLDTLPENMAQGLGGRLDQARLAAAAVVG